MKGVSRNGLELLIRSWRSLSSLAGDLPGSVFHDPQLAFSGVVEENANYYIVVA